MTLASDPVALVVTSIAAPNQALQVIADGCRRHGVRFIVVGDESSPSTFHLDGCRFYSLAEQLALDFGSARKCPTRHYARKNVGYLAAIRDGASILVETDDDNFPEPDFWSERRRRLTSPAVSGAGWVNVYRYFTEAHIWPRGLPLEHVQAAPPPFESLAERSVDCLIQQGLANENPDVDAIYRLTSPLPQSFRSDRRVALASGTWSPFNSQNTTWWRDAFPLLYLPAHCSMRMTDTWRSFIAQRICWANDWAVLFHEPTVRQERNPHDLLRDFSDELPGYLNNAALCEALGALSIAPGIEHLGDNLRLCYELLVRMKMVGAKELDLLEHWLGDLEQLSPAG